MATFFDQAAKDCSLPYINSNSGARLPETKKGLMTFAISP